MPKQFLIKNATLVQKGHPQHLKKIDILINGGNIEKIGSNIKADATLIEGVNLFVSAGWHDMRTHLTDPGLEHKDDLEHLCDSAASGGFCSISTLPDSLPVIDSKSGIQYLLNRTNKALVQIAPYGTVSEQLQGENLAELFDMQQNGAVGFTDADRQINSGLLKKALLYVQPFNGLIISFALDRDLHHEGMVNESVITVSTGLKASPALAEFACVKQQLDILEYCEGKLHFSCISTKESVELIRKAKANGLKVTCDTSIFNLCFTDSKVANFNADYKLMPMLRSEDDRKALIKGINDGTIDAICSNHHPQNVELKKVEFDYADFGSLSYQTLYSWYNEFLTKDIALEQFVVCLTSKPKEILGLSVPEIKEKHAATLTVFDSSIEWTLNEASNKSISVNSPYWNKENKGKVLAVFNNKLSKTYA